MATSNRTITKNGRTFDAASYFGNAPKIVVSNGEQTKEFALGKNLALHVDPTSPLGQWMNSQVGEEVTLKVTLQSGEKSAMADEDVDFLKAAVA